MYETVGDSARYFFAGECIYRMGSSVVVGRMSTGFGPIQWTRTSAPRAAFPLHHCECPMSQAWLSARCVAATSWQCSWCHARVDPNKRKHSLGVRPLVQLENTVVSTSQLASNVVRGRGDGQMPSTRIAQYIKVVPVNMGAAESEILQMTDQLQEYSACSSTITTTLGLSSST